MSITERSSEAGNEDFDIGRYGAAYWHRIDEQIHNIEAKLEKGTEKIKAGHRVKNLNPNGEEVHLPLSQAKKDRLEWNLQVLRHGYHYILTTPKAFWRF